MRRIVRQLSRDDVSNADVRREVLIIKCKTDQTDIETIETIQLVLSFPISKFAEWLRNEGREGYANGTLPKTQ